MSSFIERQGAPQVGDSAKVKKIGEIILIDKIKTEYSENFWIATPDYIKYIIVYENDLKDIGYFG